MSSLTHQALDRHSRGQRKIICQPVRAHSILEPTRLKGETVQQEEDTLSPEEFSAKLNALSQADLLRLRGAGRQYAAGTIGTWEDLLHDAICLTIEGTRHCSRSMTVLAHLRSTMRSLASNIRKKDGRIKTVSIGSPIDLNDEDDLTVDPKDPNPNSEIRLSHQECMNTLFGLFENDDENTGLVLTGIAMGQTPVEIQMQVGITSTEYDTIRKRIRRGVNKAYPEGLPI